jgi:hypothetical protein
MIRSFCSGTTREALQSEETPYRRVQQENLFAPQYQKKSKHMSVSYFSTTGFFISSQISVSGVIRSFHGRTAVPSTVEPWWFTFVIAFTKLYSRASIVHSFARRHETIALKQGIGRVTVMFWIALSAISS